LSFSHGAFILALARVNIESHVFFTDVNIAVFLNISSDARSSIVKMKYSSTDCPFLDFFKVIIIPDKKTTGQPDGSQLYV
jgi:hypothetical protein